MRRDTIILLTCGDETTPIRRAGILFDRLAAWVQAGNTRYVDSRNVCVACQVMGGALGDSVLGQASPGGGSAGAVRW